jgi:hypothetical protein
MLQPYRTVRPHDADQCADCAPSGQGHQQCQAPGCDNLAAFQTRRHATQAEYDAIPEGRRPIHGVAHQTVFACDVDEHAEATVMYCTHAPPKAGTCPTCKAPVDAQCVKADGTPRKLPHAARFSVELLIDGCTHAHREDCPVFEGCQCTTGDAAPPRIARTPPARDHADGTNSKLPAVLVKPLVDAHDVPWWTVRTYATQLAQDQAPILTVVHAVLDNDGNVVHDEHGHEQTDTLTIVIDPTTPHPRAVAR